MSITTNRTHVPATTIGMSPVEPVATNVAAYCGGFEGGQAHISEQADQIASRVNLHLSGTPEQWRKLARAIENAAMDLERLLHEQVHAESDAGEHYATELTEAAAG